MKINILYFTILFCLFLNSLYLKAVPNSGTLLNFENELKKLKTGDITKPIFTPNGYCASTGFPRGRVEVEYL